MVHSVLRRLRAVGGSLPSCAVCAVRPGIPRFVFGRTARLTAAALLIFAIVALALALGPLADVIENFDGDNAVLSRT